MQQDVLGLDVAVHDIVMMRVVERTRDLPGDRQRLVDAELFVTLQAVAQRFSPHVRLHVPQKTVGLPRIDQGENVGVIEPRGDLDFIDESFGAELRGDLGPQHLERDLAVVLPLAREIDGRHPARADLSLNVVTGGEGRREALHAVQHRYCTIPKRLFWAVIFMK